MKKSTFNYLLIFTALLFALKMQAQNIPGLTRYDRPDGVTLARWVNTNAVVVDSENRVWVGTQGQGGNHPGVLACLTEGTWEVFTSQNSGLPSDTIYSLVSFEDRLYIGTSQGIAIYDGNWELISPDDGLAGRHVFSLFLDTEKIIAGTENGLSVFSNGTWQNYNTGNSVLINDTVQAITHDGSGALWLGTRDGISIYHNGVWTAYHSQNSTLTAPDIRALKFDGYGNLWVGTMQNGLFKFAGGQFYPASELFKFTRDDFDVHSFVVNEEGDIFTSIRFQKGSQYLVKISNEHLIIYNVITNSPQLYFTDGKIWFKASYLPQNLFSFNLEEGLAFDHFKRMDINNISTDFTAGGMVAWDNLSSSSSYREAGYFEAPAGSGKHTIFTHSLWIGGMANDTVLHFAGDLYRQKGRDFWPGPVSAESATYQQEQEKWNRVWKISKPDIEYHINHYNNPGYEMPAVIEKWPAHGDTLAGQEWFIAPYMDVNANGLYEPHLGDYPLIRGDQALFFVFNDHRLPNTDSEGERLGVEIRGMAYAFDNPADSALHHTIFANYQAINRSAQYYDSVYTGFFTDFDIGFHLDDYNGCDTMLQAYFGYNAGPVDGSGQPSAYGEHPPAQSVVFLNQKLSTFIEPAKMLDMLVWPPPYTATKRYFNMQAKWFNGDPMVTGGLGHPYHGGDSIRAWHLYPGDLNDPTQWHELSVSQSKPGPRRSLGSTYIGTFEPGQRICFDIAFVFARDYEGDNISSVTLMKERIEQVREFYSENFSNDCMDLTATHVHEPKPVARHFLKVYPNPASDILTMEYVPDSPQANYQLYNAMGSFIHSSRITSGLTRIPLIGLTPGLYILVVEDGGRILQQKFIRQ
jgi:hypothetical protein